MRVFDGTGYRDATPDEIAAWEEASSQPAPPPSPQEQAMTLARIMAASATGLSDTTALAIPDLLPTWAELLAADNKVDAGVCLVHDGQTYRVVQAVTPIESQPPDMDGMLAVYRPIERAHTGTLSDPIPWVSGMDCEKDKYYSHNGVIYRAKNDMIPCVWEPGTDNETVWEVVK